MEPLRERYGYYSPAPGPVSTPGYRGRIVALSPAILCPAEAHRVGSAFIPRCQELEHQLSPAGGASRGASRPMVRSCSPSTSVRRDPIDTGPVLWVPGFLGYPDP